MDMPFFCALFSTKKNDICALSLRRFSIFDKMRSKPKVAAQVFGLFEELADPKDVVLQYAQCRKSYGPHDSRICNALGVKAAGMLKFFSLEDVHIILGSLAHHQWKDEVLLQGLTESIKFLCEARRG